ncbi:MAG TPA: dienelactone hydrolase family protein [Oligoflexus sp.]|uniref:alpha/beta hydrolase n=1 Tax=Oligoflexus sp. TaxID=1971216 RepID=UPI002D2ECA5A|nr:dienelactone hydrolase family protein [Oligoflexus sp.]HYX36178.1 dienelactone hydrolase family protein [Oligoflexus sp.]
MHSQETREPHEDSVKPSRGLVRNVQLPGKDGTIRCCFHPAEPGSVAILWVFGSGGGLGGPAGGLYIRHAEQWAERGVASLRLDYRHPGLLQECFEDVRRGLDYLAQEQRPQVILVGHSFGGAVVIGVGADHPQVIAVAALSSQATGTEKAARISPRPLLLMHGTADEILPADCSEAIYRRAHEPKKLLLYPRCRHGLDECRDEIDRDLEQWLQEQVELQKGGAWRA